MSADVIVQARRSAGLSQRALAERLGRDRATVVRWERATNNPSLDTLLEVLAACGRGLHFELANADDSYDRLIDRQLRLPHFERVEVLSPAAFAPLRTLQVLSEHGVASVVIGDVAAAVHGSPLELGDRTLSIVPAPGSGDALAGAAAALDADEPKTLDEYWGRHARQHYRHGDDEVLEVIEHPAGTSGYADLARHAEPVTLDNAIVRVAALVDLIRIADASPWPRDHSGTSALRAVSQRRRRLDRGQATAA